MCGRYTIAQAERLEEAYREIERRELLVPRFNVAPTQEVPLVLDESPEKLSAARWGLIPAWAKDKKIASSLINARGETVSVKPAFRSAYKKRRCLIPADGFYEWKRVGAGKVPHRITGGDGILFRGVVGDVERPRGRAIANLHDHHMRGQCPDGGNSQPHAGDSPSEEPVHLAFPRDAAGATRRPARRARPGEHEGVCGFYASQYAAESGKHADRAGGGGLISILRFLARIP